MECYIKFVLLVERLSALSFSNSDLELLIDEFFCSYLESFADVNIKIKAHFLRHYADLIRRFIPLVKTLRFKSKHQYVNALTYLTKNRKSMCQSLAKIHQFTIYIQYAKDYFLDHYSALIFISKEISPEALKYHDKKVIDEKLILNTSDLLTQGSGVVFEGQRYSVGDVVVLSLF